MSSNFYGLGISGKYVGFTKKDNNICPYCKSKNTKFDGVWHVCGYCKGSWTIDEYNNVVDPKGRIVEW